MNQYGLNPFVENQILEVLESVSNANHISTACDLAGINRSTFNKWMKRGEVEETGIYHDLYLKVKRAEAISEIGLLQIIREAAPDDWRAAAHILERRWPNSWGKHDRVSVDQTTDFSVRWKNDGDEDKKENEGEALVENQLAELTTSIVLGELTSGAD